MNKLSLQQFLQSHFSDENITLNGPYHSRFKNLVSAKYYFVDKQSKYEVGFLNVHQGKDKIKVDISFHRTTPNRFDISKNLRNLIKTYYYKKSVERIRLLNGTSKLVFDF